MGFTGINVQSTTWEPGVEGYLAMESSLHTKAPAATCNSVEVSFWGSVVVCQQEVM